MPLRPVRRARRGVIGAPVARTAAVVAAGEGAPAVEPRHLFPGRADVSAGEEPLTFQEATRRYQRQLVARTLDETGWNVSEAARRLDLARRSARRGEHAIDLSPREFDLLLADNYGHALLRGGEFKQARDVIKEAVDLSRAIHGEQSPEVLPILMNYADSQAAVNNSGRQEKVYTQALEIADAVDQDRSIKGATKRTANECCRGFWRHIDGLIHRCDFGDRNATINCI